MSKDKQHSLSDDDIVTTPKQVTPDPEKLARETKGAYDFKNGDGKDKFKHCF